jgi:hypothetical protein
LTVEGFIASLNVTTTGEFTATLVALFNGDTFVTVGGVLSAAPAVVNVAVKSGVSEFPAASFAPEVTLRT